MTAARRGWVFCARLGDRPGAILAAKLAVVLLLGGVLLLSNLGARFIAHSDEGRYIGRALAAKDTGEWVLPASSSSLEGRSGKPPLSYLPIAWMTRLAGDTKLAYRLPTALSVLLGLLLLVVLGERMSPGVGLVAALLLLASPPWLAESRRIWMENTVVTCDLAAILLFYLAKRYGRPRLTWVALLPIAWGLLSKQVAGGFGLATILLVEGAGDWRRLPRLLLFSLLALSPLGAWFVLLRWRLGAEADWVFSYEVMERLLGFRHQLRQPGDYVEAVARVLTWGTTAAGILGLGTLARRGFGGRDAAERFLWLAPLVYCCSSFLIFGVVSRSFRGWWPIPAAWMLSLAAAVALVEFFWLGDQNWLARCAGFVAFAVLFVAGWGNSDALLVAAAVVALAWAAAQRLGSGQARRWFPRWAGRPRLWLGTAFFLLVAWGTDAGFARHGRVEGPDRLEVLIAEVQAEKPTTIFAQGHFFRDEFRHYLRGVDLTRLDPKQSCATPKAGETFAFLVRDKPPGCWRTWSKKRGRFRNFHYLVAHGAAGPDQP